MGIISNIRNFFYAATHANQLITENAELNTKNLELAGKLWKAQSAQSDTFETLEAVRQHRDRLTNAMKILAPKDLSRDTLQDLYNASFHSAYEYEKAGEHLFDHCWHARQFIQNEPIWETIEAEVYRSALTSANILPQVQVNPSAINYLQARAESVIDAQFDYEQLSADIPIGRIDYLQPPESIEYQSAGKFISDIMHNNHYGVPMAITVYSDPASGKHIDTSWRLNLDPPPQGFQVEPYEAPVPTPEPTPEFELE